MESYYRGASHKNSGDLTVEKREGFHLNLPPPAHANVIPERLSGSQTSVASSGWMCTFFVTEQFSIEFCKPKPDQYQQLAEVPYVKQTKVQCKNSINKRIVRVDIYCTIVQKFNAISF